MAVVFVIMTTLTVIVIVVLVLRYQRGKYPTGTKKYTVFVCIYTIYNSDVNIHISSIMYRGSVDIPVTTNKALELSNLSREAAYM